MVIVVGPSNVCVCDVWIDFLHMVFCRSTFKQRVARPRRYGFCIALFLRCRSSKAPSAQRRPRRVAVTINAGHELSELARLRRPKIDRCGFLVSCVRHRLLGSIPPGRCPATTVGRQSANRAVTLAKWKPRAVTRRMRNFRRCRYSIPSVVRADTKRTSLVIDARYCQARAVSAQG
jgi:hypothetical protein